MSDEYVVKSMITFIEKKERQLQLNKFTNIQQVKSDVVKAILDELEREVSNENK